MGLLVLFYVGALLVLPYVSGFTCVALRVLLYVSGFTCVALRERLAIHGGFLCQSLALRVTFDKSAKVTKTLFRR